MRCCRFGRTYKKSSPRRQLKRPQLFPTETTKRTLSGEAIFGKSLVVPHGDIGCSPQGPENDFYPSKTTAPRPPRCSPWPAPRPLDTQSTVFPERMGGTFGILAGFRNVKKCNSIEINGL